MKITCSRVGGASAEIRRLWIVFWAGAAIALFEAAGGLFSGSLALLSDAGHVLADNGSTAIALFVAYRAARATEERRAALRRRGAVILALSLLITGLWIMVEASRRIGSGERVIAPAMIAIALVGAACNYVQHAALHRAHASEKHEMHRLLHQHVLSDLFQSLSVAVAGALVWATGWTPLDALASLAIGALMARWGILGLLGRQAGHDHAACSEGACLCAPPRIELLAEGEEPSGRKKRLRPF